MADIQRKPWEVETENTISISKKIYIFFLCLFQQTLLEIKKLSDDLIKATILRSET
jgi:hypothetical protein